MASRADGNAAKRLATTSAGPWRKLPGWSTMSRHGRCMAFIERYCAAPKGVGWGKPLVLDDSQKEFIEDALAPGVSAAIRSTPRGNGKSTLGGAIGVWATFDDDLTGQPQVPIIATTITQAMRSCYGVGVSMIKAHPDLLSRALIYTGIGSSRVVVPSNYDGEMFPVSNDPDGLQGLDPSVGIVDEIGFQPSLSWDSLHLAQGKRPSSVVLGLGTPGVDTENALWTLRGTLPAVSNRGRNGAMVFHEYAAPEGCDTADRRAWRIGNPALVAGFLAEEAIAADLVITPEVRFRIFRLGQWQDAAPMESWLGDNATRTWADLAQPHEFADKAATWVGVDMGLRHDSTAVCLVQRRGDKYHAKWQMWLPEPERPVDTTDVMAYLRGVAKRYDVQAISYDPRYFDVPAAYLSDEGLPMIEVPQSVERMTVAVGQAYEAIGHGTLTHDGDEVVAQQVAGAVPRYNDRGFTLSKPKSRVRIDAAVALALALDRALQDRGERRVLARWA